MAKMVCPYCFSGTDPATLPYRCLMNTVGIAGSQPCAPVPDPRQAAALHRPGGIHSGPIFTAKARRGAVECPDCRGHTTQRLCPECHRDLPADYSGQGTKVIALVGPKSAGKSTYITVLVHELRTRIGEQLGSALSPMDDASSDRYDDMHRMMYVKDALPATTRPAAVELTDPLLFRLGLPGRRGSRRRSRHVVLAFFDAAGEDLQTEAATQRYARYLSAADGILLLCDPLQLPVVRDLVGAAGGDLPPEETAPDRIAAQSARTLRAQRGLPTRKRISVPLAVALSKVDALDAALPAGHRLSLHEPGPPVGEGIDPNDLAMVHDEVSALMTHWQQGALARQLDTDFEDWRYFAVSALGDTPQGPGRAPAHGIHPLRVADPLLWLLARFGLVPVRRKVR
ncbi:hypothetical protein [Streptomyces sp. SID3343]|uniref:TRAFAC clade GTPase domain-containing protein n=1 Tax=Streptomyces sp. SID3343 TaxID=2690260 RepID=UPI001371E7E4|nr:hypothetical protein [Streptomyces sp. SID3343]MYW05333.1 hypothetical protein [Streptomyces sp. SID3343]